MNLPAQEKKSSILANLLLFIVVLFLFLAIGEGFLRWKFPDKIKSTKKDGWAIIPEESWIEYHSTLGWQNQKNKKAFLKKNHQEVPLTTNSIGLRGSKEYTIEKPSAETLRIYALGDSFTFGFGVQDHESFPALMESLRPNLEVFNAGIPGYGIDQIYLSLKELGYSYKPDVILITIYPEDFWRATRAFNDAGHGKPYFVLKDGSILELKHVPVPKNKKFKVAQFPISREWSGPEKFLRKSKTYVLFSRLIIKLKKLMGFEDPDSSDEWLLGREILKKMTTEIKNQGVRPIIVIAPPLRWITGTLEPVRDSLLRFGKVNHVTVVDLTPILKKASQETSPWDYYIKEDQHWTPKGNELVAKTLLTVIDSSSLSPEMRGDV